MTENNMVECPRCGEQVYAIVPCAGRKCLPAFHGKHALDIKCYGHVPSNEPDKVQRVQEMERANEYSDDNL